MRVVAVSKAIPERIRLAFEVAPVPMLLSSPDGIILHLNRDLALLFGHAPEALVGASVDTLVPPDLRQRHAAHRKDFEAHPARRQMGHGRDLEGVTADGRLIPLELGLHPITVDDVSYVIVTVVDIARRQSAEASARVVLNAAGSAMLLVDTDGGIMYANPEANRLFGYARESLLGASIDQLVPADLRDRHASYRARFAAAPAPRTMAAGSQLHARRADGSEFRVEVALTPVRFAGRQLVLATVVDLTARIAVVRAEAEKAAAMVQAERLVTLNAELRQLSRGISHEFKGPMATVAGLAALAVDDLAAGDADAVRECLEKLQEEARSGAEKVEGLTGLTAAWEAVDRNAETVDIAPLVYAAWSDAGGATRSDVKLELELQHNAPLRCHRQSLALVMEELLSNAIKFRHAQRDARVQVRTAQQRDVLLFAVQDNGIGMPAERLEHVFDPFVRLTDRPGHGLGLALVRRNVDRLGGTICAKPVESGGISFEIQMPMGGQP